MVDTYCFVNPQVRQEYRESLEASGVKYELTEETEVIESEKTKGLRTTLYLLHAERVSPTLKQLLSASTKVPLT